MEGQFRRGSMVFPVIIIVAGIVFLLNNLNLLDWSIWSMMWRLWPIALIGVGLDVLIGGRYRWGSAVVAGTLLVILGGAITLSAMQIVNVPSLEAGPVYGALGDATRAEVEIRSGVSVLRIDSTSDAGTLLTGQVSTSANERLEQDHGFRGDSAYYRLRGETWLVFPNFRGDTAGTWNLQLTDKVPIDLRIGTGVGKSDLILTGLTLSNLKVDSGVGKTNVWLPKTGRFKADLNIGVGDITIYIPKELAARIRTRTGIGAKIVTGDYEKNGDYYTSPGFGSAEHRVELEISGGVGKVSIEQR